MHGIITHIELWIFTTETYGRATVSFPSKAVLITPTPRGFRLKLLTTDCN